MKETTSKEEFAYEVLTNVQDSQIKLHSYIVKTKSTRMRNVLMMSLLEHLMAVTKDDEKRKPQIYKIYDFTKGGTDITDQKA